MGRHALRITIVLGMLVSLLGGTGIFATFTDRATGGQATVSSGARPKAADLKVAPAVPDTAVGDFGCGTYVDDVAGTVIEAINIQPGDTAGQTWLCVKNAGSGTLDVTATIADLTNTDLGCSGDEADAGDSCDQADDPGELGSLLLLDYELLDCATVVQGNFKGLAGFTEAPSYFIGTPWAFSAAPMAPGDVACFRIVARYRPDVTEQLAQLAQSDEVTWKFAFDATAQ